MIINRYIMILLRINFILIIIIIELIETKYVLEYVDSGLVFLEIKTKNNKGKTIKKRMKVKSISDKLNSEQQEYINKIIGNEISVEPKQWINFYRMTFVHKKQKERLTVDVDLTFSENDKKGDLKNIIIGEVKQERMSKVLIL